MFHPWLFANWSWEHLLLWGKWSEENGAFIGAIAFTLVGIVAVTAYFRREGTAKALLWMRDRLPWSAIAAGPAIAFLLLSLNKYLTFASALATTIGVLVALSNNQRTQENVAQARDREEKRFERQGMAARSALSLELSSLNDYCNDLIGELNNIHLGSKVGALTALLPSLNFPAPSASVAATFKEMINSTADEKIASRCSSILSQTQLVKGNVQDLIRKPGSRTQYSIEHVKVRVVFLQALTISMFPYSRHTAGTVHMVEWDDVDYAMLLQGLDRNASFTKYYDFQKSKYPNSPFDMYKVATR